MMLEDLSKLKKRVEEGERLDGEIKDAEAVYDALVSGWEHEDNSMVRLIINVQHKAYGARIKDPEAYKLIKAGLKRQRDAYIDLFVDL